MTDIKTGSGGFVIDGETHEFDVVPLGEEGIEPSPVDRGNMTVDETVKDVSKSTRETLGKYLHALTRGNTYPVDPAITDVKLTDTQGVPTPLLPEPTNTSTHSSNIPTSQYDVGQQLKSGARLLEKVVDPIGDLDISKGKTEPQKPNGHSVLKSVTDAVSDANIGRYTTAVLANNRFSDAARARAVNVVDPPRDFNPAHVHPRYGDVASNRLAQVGVALTLRASQELGATADGNNPSSGGQEAKSLLPGFNQLGVSRINTSVLEARTVLENLTEDDVPDGNIVSAAPGGSWGSLNNPQDPYSGITAIGMIALSVAMTAATVVLFQGLASLLSMVKGGQGGAALRDSDGRYALGHYQFNQAPDSRLFPPSSFPPDIGLLLGIRPTVHPFDAALQKGVTTFFGIDTDGGILGTLASGLDSATDSPGFNVIVARSITRSSLSVIDTFKDAFKSPNLVAGIKNVLSIIDAIKTSKLIAAINVFATLGDAALTAEETGDVVQSDIEGLPGRISTIDSLPDNSPAVMKNRLSGELKLAWSSNRSPAAYLIPDSLLTFTATGGALGAFWTGLGVSHAKAKNFFRVLSLSEQIATGARIPYDSEDPAEITVKSIESMLEAEHMPFYFHDLRTNEIISFHAFITAMSEDFTPSWEATDGFGRADQVRVYKSTARRLTFSFYVIATSEEDFDDMWLKINKLITMVYPQYTVGRVLSDEEGNNKFVQPFSQLMSASPLIRLRIGDLIRSNYSRFNLARLFGADTNSVTLDGTPLEMTGGAAGLQKFSSAVQRELSSPVGKKFVLGTNNLQKPTQAGGLSLSLPSLPGVKSSGGSFAPSFNVLLADIPFFIFSCSKELSDKSVVVTPDIASVDYMQKQFGMSIEAATAQNKRLKEKYGSSVASRVIGGAYVAPKSALRLTPDRIQSLLKDAFGAVTDSVDKLVDFLDPEKNAIVKAFKSTAGKGLAGTLDSLNFEWVDNSAITWEIAPNRRAPKVIKISTSFTPIHDIAPGLDANGYNRGPVYPVGHLAHGNDSLKTK